MKNNDTWLRFFITEEIYPLDETNIFPSVPDKKNPEIIDVYSGIDDLRRCVIRVLHPKSFEDDPTRRLLGDVINEVKNATKCRASPVDLNLKTFINNI